MERYIAFLDILGFKDIVNNNSHEDLIKKFENIFSIGIEISISNGEYLLRESETKKVVIADMSKSLVNCVIISDSVIFWTDDDTTKSFIDLIVCVRNLLAHSNLVGFPLRGGITLGDMSIFRKNMSSQSKDITFQTWLGRGIIEAYLIENKQDWAGCIIDMKAIENYRLCTEELAKREVDIASLDYLIEKRLIVKYNVPLKEAYSEEHVINWVSKSRTPPSEERRV